MKGWWVYRHKNMCMSIIDLNVNNYNIVNELKPFDVCGTVSSDVTSWNYTEPGSRTSETRYILTRFTRSRPDLRSQSDRNSRSSVAGSLYGTPIRTTRSVSYATWQSNGLRCRNGLSRHHRIRLAFLYYALENYHCCFFTTRCRKYEIIGLYSAY